MAIKIYPYKQGSKSARALADAIGGRVLKLEGSSYVAKSGDTIINWGSSRTPHGAMEISGLRVLNPGMAVQIASNKRHAFVDMLQRSVNVPDFWTNQGDIPDDAFPIVCRTVLNGHSGVGIVIADNRDGLVPAPLYVRYVKKQDEYRIHIIGQSIIAQQRKARRADCENPNWKVRNHQNGFVFVREGVQPPEDVRVQALAAIEALGLDFGAVDVIWNSQQQRAYVLEVNCAPGLEGQTITDYANAFRALISAT